MIDRTFERLGRNLMLADLRPCGFNLYHRPDSWFDTFVQWETGVPPNYAEWQPLIAESAYRQSGAYAEWLDEQWRLQQEGAEQMELDLLGGEMHSPRKLEID